MIFGQQKAPRFMKNRGGERREKSINSQVVEDAPFAAFSWSDI
jgi:hypothetical protein